MKQDKAKARG